MSKEINKNSNDFPKFYVEIRARLISVALMFILGATIGLFYSKRIMLFTMNLVDLSGVNVVTTSPSQFISLAFNTSLFFGLLFAIPVLVYQFYKFSLPALKKEEVEFINKFVPISTVLFLTGFSFGIWVSKFVFLIFAQMSHQFNINNILDIQNLFSQIIFTGLLVGFIFQMPIVVSLLTKFKVVTYKQLKTKRRFVYGILVIVAVLLPPTDVISLIMILLPLFALFEISLLLNLGSNLSMKGGA